MPWKARGTVVSWANRPLGVPSCPAPPCPAALPCAALPRPARGMSGFWIRPASFSCIYNIQYNIYSYRCASNPKPGHPVGGISIRPAVVQPRLLISKHQKATVVDDSADENPTNDKTIRRATTQPCQAKDSRFRRQRSGTNVLNQYGNLSNPKLGHPMGDVPVRLRGLHDLSFLCPNCQKNMFWPSLRTDASE